MLRTILSEKVKKVFSRGEAIYRQVSGKVVETCRRRRMKYPTRHCEICNRQMRKNQIDFSRREYRQNLCMKCQKDEERDKSLRWINQDDDSIWMFG